MLRRLIDRPIIVPAMLPGDDGGNINGPSLIAVPDWVPDRLGRFYLYFAHHKGRYIRLAYADDLDGPWLIHAEGSLHLGDAPACRDHIASPDVHVDHARRQIVLFFHGVARNSHAQRTFRARSADGIRFAVEESPVAEFYFRAVPWRRQWIAMSKGGVAYLGRGLAEPWVHLPQPLFPMRHPQADAAGDVRHVALRVIGDRLHVFHTLIGDAPERIWRATVDLAAPPASWRAAGRDLVLAPERPWEGAGLPVAASVAGPAGGPENALRDPALFSWEGRTYLLYSVAGESGIGIAELAA